MEGVGPSGRRGTRCSSVRSASNGRIGGDDTDVSWITVAHRSGEGSHGVVDGAENSARNGRIKGRLITRNADRQSSLPSLIFVIPLSPPSLASLPSLGGQPIVTSLVRHAIGDDDTPEGW